MSASTIRPTARLTGLGWGLILLGLVVLIGGWALAFDSNGLTDITAPIGWVVLLAGIVLQVLAAVRRAQNRDSLQARAAKDS